MHPNPFDGGTGQRVSRDENATHRDHEEVLNGIYIEKYDLSNELEIVIRINANNTAFWDNVDFTRMVSLSTMTAFDSYTVKRNMDGTISIIAKYNTDIHSINITVQFNPKNSGLQALSNYTASQK